jgi:hypothetical protein
MTERKIGQVPRQVLNDRERLRIKCIISSRDRQAVQLRGHF